MTGRRSTYARPAAQERKARVEVKIGVYNAPREIVFESEDGRDAILAALRESLASDEGLLVLSDEKGRTVAVPGSRVAYLELGEESSRRVGFGAR